MDTSCGPQQTFLLFYSHYNGHLGGISLLADTSCGPQQTFLLFYSLYNGHLGRISLLADKVSENAVNERSHQSLLERYRTSSRNRTFVSLSFNASVNEILLLDTPIFYLCYCMYCPFAVKERKLDIKTLIYNVVILDWNEKCLNTISVLLVF